MSLGIWSEYGLLHEVAGGTAEGAMVPNTSDDYPPELWLATPLACVLPCKHL